MVRLSISAGSRQPSSSSPTSTSTGVAHPGQLVAQRRTATGRAGLHAAHGQRGAQRGMPGQRRGELRPAARVLVLELHPGRADRVPLGHLRRALGLERGRGGLALGAERVLARSGWRAVARRRPPPRTATRSGCRERQVQRGEAAHGQADHVRPADAQAVQHRDRVGDRALLGVGRRVGGHVRRRVAAGRVGHAAVAAGEEPDLRLPAPVVAGELVDEQQRLAAGRCSSACSVTPSSVMIAGIAAPLTAARSGRAPDTSFTGSAPMMC